MASTDFYSAAAAVFPLLFLALVFETRDVQRWGRLARALSLSKDVMEVARSVLYFVLALVLGIGGFAAFVGITHPDGTSFAPWHTGWIVAVSLMIGGATFIAMPLVFTISELLRLDKDHGVPRPARLMLVVVAPALVVYLVFSIGVWALLH